MKYKVNDTVQVVLGKDKGKVAKVTSVKPGNKVVVEGINTYKRHIKKQNRENQGGIVEVERPIDIAKIQLVCPSCKKITRIGYQIQTGGKIRICKKCQAVLDK